MILALLFLVFTVALGWVLLPRRRVAGDFRPASMEAKFLLAVIVLYALPLPIAVLLGSEGGNISVYLDNFAPWLPAALYFTSCFVLCFVGFYRWFLVNRVKTFCWREVRSADARRFNLIWLALFGLSIVLLGLLGQEVGGVLNLILSGYHVTELFVGRGYLAISFEWLVSLLVVLMSYGIVSKRLAVMRWAGFLGILLLVVLAVMGRRGMLATMILAFAYLAIQAGWVERIRRLLFPGVIIFVFLNWLGLVRGESYSDVTDLSEALIEKTAALSANGELMTGLFYTLSHGNFVVPFETLPQIMESLARSPDYWIGLSIVRSFALMVPGSLLPDRPLPLANWYMATFYGGGFDINEGRQFFFLAEAYLNFGWLGCAIWGLIISGFFWLLLRPRSRGLTYWELALRALFFGSLLNFVAADTTGFFVSFFKGLGLVPLVFAVLGTGNAKNAPTRTHDHYGILPRRQR